MRVTAAGMLSSGVGDTPDVAAQRVVSYRAAPMAPTNKPSEFGGSGVKRNGVFPRPHIPTASEQLGLIYRTGDPSGEFDPDNGESMSGLLPLEEQVKLRKDAGDLDKGQVWEEIVQAAESVEVEVEVIG